MPANKNSSRASVAGKNKAQIAPEVGLFQTLNKGSHMRVFLTSGKSVHGETSSDQVSAAIAALVQEGYGSRLRRQAEAIAGDYPRVTATVLGVVSAESEAN